MPRKKDHLEPSWRLVTTRAMGVTSRLPHISNLYMLYMLEVYAGRTAGLQLHRPVFVLCFGGFLFVCTGLYLITMLARAVSP